MKRTQSVSRKDSIKKQNASPGMKRLTDYFPVLGNIQSTSPKNRDESDQSGSAGAQCTPQKVSTDYHPEKDQKDGMKMKIPTQTVSNAATTTAFFDLSTESEPLSSVSMDSSSVDSPFRLRDQNKTLAIRTSSSPISSEHAPSTPTGRYHVGALVDSISLPLGTKSRPMVEIPVLRSVRIAEGRVGTQSAKSDEISKIDSQCQAGIKSTQLESLDQESLFILQSNSEHQSLQRDSPISPTKKQPSSASSTLSLTSSKRKRIVDSDSEEPSSEKKVNDSSYEPMNPKTKAPRVTNDCDDSSLDSPINFDDDDLEDLMFFEFSKPAHQKKPTSTPGPAKYESDHELDAHSRRSTRARKEVSYKPPPLDPFKDEALFAGTGSSNRTSSLKNDITSELEKLEQSHYSVPKRFSLDALLVDRKRNEETERQRRELGDTFKKLAEEEDTDFLSLTSTAGSKNVFAALEQIKAEDSALYQAFGRFLKAGEAPVKLSRVKLCREPIDERIEPSKPFPKFKDSISKALRKTKDGLSQMEIIHAALSLSNWHLKSEHGEWLFDTVCFASDYRVVQKATSILLKSLSDKKNEWDVSLSSLASFFENACRCDPRILTQFYRDTQNNMGKVNVPMTGLADAFIANGKDEQSERSDESRQTALDAKQINLRSVVCIATEAFIRR
ncbi:hypothetical protein BJ742DRAFT_459430 [Cladochytrium replicatum]|nr:hypothetical protein BJ742DRAFT_459430 [Cladochytrium replicatum]